MGKVVTVGKAVKKFEAEKMNLNIIVKKLGSNTGKILSEVQKQCEDILAELNNIGISPEMVRLEDFGISQNYNSDDFYAEKHLMLETKIDIKLCTYIFSIIKKYEDTILYNVSYSMIDEDSKLEEMLNIAVEDSRRQAEIIASSLGKKIIGVESVNDREYIPRGMAKMINFDYSGSGMVPEAFNSDTPLADRTGIPLVEKLEEISITWSMSE